MTNENLGARLKEARVLAGITQSELASLMGWKSHGTIVALESGAQPIKTWELLKIAEILHVSASALYSSNPVVKSTQVLWRNKSSNQAVQLKDESLVSEHIENYRLLKRLLKSETQSKCLPWYEISLEKADREYANRLALTIHKEFRLGDYPALTLRKCLEEVYGVLFIGLNLENGSAACSRGDWGTAVIQNNRNIPWRQTFDLAHELFHLITWDSTLLEKVQTKSIYHDNNEIMADAFAGALLMPAEMIELDLSHTSLSYVTVIALARKYKVSTSALLWRLYHLRHMSYDSVMTTLKDKDFKNLDKSTFFQAAKMAESFDDRFVRLAYLTCEKGFLSKAKLARMLRVKLRDLDDYLTEQGLYLTNDKEIGVYPH